MPLCTCTWAYIALLHLFLIIFFPSLMFLLLFCFLFFFLFPPGCCLLVLFFFFSLPSLSLLSSSSSSSFFFFFFGCLSLFWFNWASFFIQTYFFHPSNFSLSTKQKLGKLKSFLSSHFPIIPPFSIPPLFHSFNQANPKHLREQNVAATLPLQRKI